MSTPPGYATNPGTGDLSKQWEWHAAFRDASKNMYRTTTQDALNFREVAVKSRFPSGYQGHCAAKAHDVSFIFKKSSVVEVSLYNDLSLPMTNTIYTHVIFHNTIFRLSTRTPCWLRKSATDRWTRCGIPSRPSRIRLTDPWRDDSLLF